MSSLLELIMRSKAIARKLNHSSSGDEFDVNLRHHNLANFHHNSVHTQLFTTSYTKEIEFNHITTLQNGQNIHQSNSNNASAYDFTVTTSGTSSPPLTSSPLGHSSSLTKLIEPRLHNHVDSSSLQPQMDLFNNKTHAERFFSEMARLQEPTCDLDIRENGVFAKVLLPRNTRFGPFAVKLSNEPLDRKLAWEVIVSAHFRGWLEPIPEISTWLRKIRAVNIPKDANLNNFLVAGYLWYETNRDIVAGEEITIDGRPRTPLQLNENFFNICGNAGSTHGDDKSERENGSQYSGNTTGDDEFNTSISEKEKRLSDQLDLEFSDDENGFDIRCEVCDKTYIDLDRLDDHLVSAHHFRKDEFSCELCSKRFCHRPSLLKHRALIHNDIRKYPCENCTKVFCDPSNLQRHIRAHHVGARSHACPECGKTFATSSGLKQHTHIHSSVKPFQCEVCFKAYTQFSNLCRHKRMHADCRMQIKCNKCGQSFSTVTSLSKHKRFCDSTSSNPGPGIAPQSSLLSSHQQSAQSRVAALQSVAAAAAVGSTLSQSNMTSPPNPFFMLRGPTPFFPGFSAAYGLQGIFPTGPTHVGSFPMLFPKHNIDMRMPPTRSESIDHSQIINKHHLSPSNKMHQQLDFNQRNTLLTSSLDQTKPTMHTNSSNQEDNGMIETNSKFDLSSEENYNKTFGETAPSKYNPCLSSMLSDEETNSSIELKIEPDENEKVGVDSQIADDNSEDIDEEKKHIDIVTTPPPPPPPLIETCLKERTPPEQPLDLTVNRKRPRSEAVATSEDIEPEQVPSHSINQEETNENKKSKEKLDDSPLNAKRRLSHSSRTSFQGSPRNSVSPGPTPSPSPPSNAPTGLITNGNAPAAMACPRPIHPMILDEIYRTRALAFQRPFPFLGPMGGRPAFDNLLHHSNGPFPPEPAYREALIAAGNLPSSVLSAVPGKIKDRYTCKFCGKVFPRSANLTRHLRTHTGEQPYTCKYCDRAFSISSNLQRHVRNIHNKERPFRCHLCDRCFGQQTNLDRHLKKHEADTTGLGIGLGDSPSSNEADREDSYFDDIRSFMGQVTYNEELYTPTSLGGGENDTDYAASDVENDFSVSRSSSTEESGKSTINNNEAIEVST